MTGAAALGVGLIGCGNISTTYLDLAPLFGAIEVRAVSDIDARAAEARAQVYGLRAETVDSLLAAEDIDIVVNLTIPAVHAEVTTRILQAGKHAWSEKPVVLTMDEGAQLRDLAKDRGLRVGSSPDTFLGGSHQLARAALDEGAIGRVTGGTCHVMSAGMEDWHPNPDFFFQPGGGPVLDLGPYYLTNLVQLLGPIQSVIAMSGQARDSRIIGLGPRQGEAVPVDTPTTVHGVLLFDSGAIVTLGASWDVAANSHPPMELYGESGTLSVPDPNFFGGPVRRLTASGAEVLAPRGHPFGHVNQELESAEPRANYRCAGLAEMAQAIVEGRDHRCNLDLALHVVDAMTALLRSGDSGRREALQTTCTRPAACPPDAAEALLA